MYTSQLHRLTDWVKANLAWACLWEPPKDRFPGKRINALSMRVILCMCYIGKVLGLLGAPWRFKQLRDGLQKEVQLQMRAQLLVPCWAGLGILCLSTKRVHSTVHLSKALLPNLLMGTCKLIPCPFFRVHNLTAVGS